MKIKIPRGWRRLRAGTLVKDGDEFNLENDWWLPTTLYNRKVPASLTYIRRIKKSKKK